MNDQTPEKPSRQGPPQPPSRYSKSLLGWVIVIGIVLLLMTYFGKTLEGRGNNISPQDFWKYAHNGYISEIVIRDKEILGTLADNTPVSQKGKVNKFRLNYDFRAERDFDKRLNEELNNHPGRTNYTYEPDSWWEGPLLQVLLMFGVLGAIWFFLFRRLGSAAGGGGFLGNFGRSRHRVSTKEQLTKITFNDVAGIDEAKDEVREIIEFLKNPRRFSRIGARIPRGVLLVGEPGCGKTLLAKAIAGEAEVPFFSISGSDFVEMFVGVGASRVRDLFRQAKESAPCIIFLDEIDAVGRRRGVAFNGGGHDEREQTLNAILVEMDGFDSSDQVIVIAATNRMDVLDPALTRPGRFDRQITVPLPDLTGRYQILKIYVNRVKTGPDVDLNRLSRGTPMFSGADLEALVNEAAIAATMASKNYVEQADLEEARDKVRWGRARKTRVIDEKEKTITAYHEAGHAMVQVMTPGADPLHKVSIIPRGPMGGATFSLPERDRYLYTRSYCHSLMCVCLGGRLAEQIFCNDISSGAASDISQATEIARKMILDWGMSDKLGPVRYAEDKHYVTPDFGGSKDYSDKTAELIDLEVKAVIDKAYSDTRSILENHRDKLEKLAQALLKYETLSGDDVRAILDGKNLDKTTVGDLLDRERNKTAPGVTISPPAVAPGSGALPQPG